ncbi:MAG: hypothetical protein Q9163_004710 [Psora crenata]
MAVTYFRLLYTVITNPGYVERSTQWHKQQGKSKRSIRSSRARSKSEKDPRANGNPANYADTGPNANPNSQMYEKHPGLQDFYSRDVFICQGDGRPIWCSNCQNWKPDRAHHCREVDRCVRKMDHFCPWVGGVVSETSFKFFIQFVGWAAVYCIFNLIVMAILVAEYRKDTGTANVHWVVTLAFGVLFGLFAIGMTGSSLQFALLNTTTIENLSRKTVVHQLAIHMPRLPQEPPPFPTISYSTAQKSETSEPSPDTIKTFAILHTKPGENVWDLGPYRNFKSVMGDHWYDWFLPIRYSPSSNHDRYDSQFPMGHVVDRLKREAGILPPVEEAKPHNRRRGRRRRRRRKRDDSIKAQEATAHQEKEKENRQQQEQEGSEAGIPYTGHDRHQGSIV